MNRTAGNPVQSAAGGSRTLRARAARSIARTVTTLALVATAAPSLAGGPEYLCDESGDAAFRPTSIQGAQSLPTCGPIDLLSLKYGGWSTGSPTTDPYTGKWQNSENAHLLRIDLTLDGLVNPPGPLAGPVTPDPTVFGPRPLYGFIEFDVDHDRDTGGETTGSAANRFLANVARFGCLPDSSIGTRAALCQKDLDPDWTTGPQFERTGADFVLNFCGCFTPTVISESGSQNNCLDAGETMVIRGRFFQRSGGYKGASFMLGGSAPGMYDPWVNLRFMHSTSSDTTTVTLVYALDMDGAACLTGQPLQAMNTSVSDHTSVAEGVQDLRNRCSAPGLSGLTWQLIHEWHHHPLDDALHVEDWRATALIGTAYSQLVDAYFVWTDVGFDLEHGDVTGDGYTNNADYTTISAFIAANDGTYADADGLANGEVTIGLFPFDYSLYDVNYDGVVGPGDVPGSPLCKADFDESGVVDVVDLFAFLDVWFVQAGMPPPLASPTADINNSGGVEVLDLFLFLDAWFAGC